MSMDIDPPGQGSPHLLNRDRVAYASRVVVDQIFLEFFYLFIGEDFLREFSNTGVGSVHDLLID